MAEQISVDPFLDKHAKYQTLLPQLSALLDGEHNSIANAANICAVLKETFSFFWIGFYFVDEASHELVLGPFQGPVACTRIAKGKGVCGTAWENKETIIVPDVSLFPGHIACNAASQSEIVVPILRDGKVTGVLDADSEQLNFFDVTDRQFLQLIVELYTKQNK
jgi:GAF domain-containing protein